MAASRTPSMTNGLAQGLAGGARAVACVDGFRIGGMLPARVRPVTHSRPEEYEPDDAEDQNCEPGRNRQEREHRWAGFGLACLGRGLDDLAMSLRCHGYLFG